MGEVHLNIALNRKEVFQILEWCVRQCVGYVLPQPQAEDESQQLPFPS